MNKGVTILLVMAMILLPACSSEKFSTDDFNIELKTSKEKLAINETVLLTAAFENHYKNDVIPTDFTHLFTFSITKPDGLTIEVDAKPKWNIAYPIGKNEQLVETLSYTFTDQGVYTISARAFFTFREDTTQVIYPSSSMDIAVE